MNRMARHPAEFPAAAPPGSARTYGQYCAMARGLDVVGDRWTLLMVRELLLGPKRYKDLQGGLPGIGTNLLAGRLREMEELGLIERRVLPPPAGSAVYQLTDVGKALEPVMFALGHWGARFLGKPRPTDVLVPSAYFIAIRGEFRADLAAGVNETYEVRIGAQVFEVRVRDGTCATAERQATDPDVVLTMDVEALNALLLEGLTASDAVADGRVAVEGRAGGLQRFVELFAIRRPGRTDRTASTQ
jgi:DNA-binding HxlR family transcriptional regulator/putative sterol carrier protein